MNCRETMGSQMMGTDCGCAACGSTTGALAGLGAGVTTTLPSVTAAEDFLDGKKGGFANVVLSTLLRAGLIGAGLYAAGEREKLVKYSLFGAVTIEAFVLVYIGSQLKKVPKTVPALAAVQRKMAYGALKSRWTDETAFDSYLGLSRRGLPVLISDDFADAGRVDAFVREKVVAAAAETGSSMDDAGFVESTTAYVRGIVDALGNVAAATCNTSPALCAALTQQPRVR